jgi:hypothetical protein
MAYTSVIVRAQAAGGKFLGMGVDSTPPPTLTISQNGKEIASGTFTLGNSGVVGARSANTSAFPIVVQPNTNPSVYIPGPHYLAASDDPPPDSLCTVSLPLTGTPTDFELTVTAYTTDLEPNNEVVVALNMLLSTSNIPPIGVIIPIPGLRITNVSVSGTTVTAHVAMMCGCMITPLSEQPKEPYWPASEFAVTASTPGAITTLACTGSSVFTGTLPGVAPGAKITISASQHDNPENRNTVVYTVP